MDEAPLQETAMEVQKVEEEDRPPRRLGRTVAILCIAVLAGFSHSYYAATLFENDRNFSYLSELEREMSLRTEMGFYYSYYKLIAQDYSFSVGISKIMYDRLVEFPTEVNAFSRFNIYPEVIVGALYRYFEPWLNTSSFVECSRVTRSGMSDVISCEGFGVPMVFYLHSVWLLAGVAVGAMFTAATTISGSMLGGILAVGQFYANHGDATRVQWAPNERENFAWPLLVLQSWLICIQLRDKKREHTFLIQLGIFVLNFLTLIFWQFTQFIYFTQLFIFFMMEQLRVIDNKSFWVFLHAHFCGIHTAILVLHGNDMLKSSIYTSFFVIVSLYSMFFSPLKVKVETRLDFLVEAWLVFLRVFIALFASFYLKKIINEFTGGQDDSHIWDLLLSKFDSAYTNFHTLLYTCSEIFDFLPSETVFNLTKTCLFPLVIVNIGLVINYYIEKSSQKEVEEKVEPKSEDGKEPGIDNNADSTLRQRNNRQLPNTIDNADSTLRQRKNGQQPTTIDNADSTLRQRNNRQQPNTIEEKNNVQQKETKDLWLEWIRRADIEPELVYSIAQLCVYGLMAVLVMRLKLLFVTQLCIMSGLIFKTKYYAYMGDNWVKSIRRMLMLLAFLTFCWVVVNVTMELSHMGDFTDPHLEEMLTWINDNTPRNAAFAGSMPCMVTIMLCTRRPIVTHPHYENAEARERAYSVYKTYGKFTPQELYEEMTKLQVSFLVVEAQYCYGSSLRNCTYGSIWDHERPELASRPPLCQLLQTARVEHFFRLFGNARYSIYMVHDYIVEYMPRSFDT